MNGGGRPRNAVNLSNPLSSSDNQCLSIWQQPICHQIFRTFPGRWFRLLYKFNFGSLQRHALYQTPTEMKSKHLCAFKQSCRSVIKKTEDGNKHSTSILKWPDVKHTFTEGLFWRWRGRHPWSISDLFTCDEQLNEVSCDQLLQSSSENLPFCMETVALSINDLCELWLGSRQCGSSLALSVTHAGRSLRFHSSLSIMAIGPGWRII